MERTQTVAAVHVIFLKQQKQDNEYLIINKGMCECCIYKSEVGCVWLPRNYYRRSVTVEIKSKLITRRSGVLTFA